ncbi:MAG: sodium-dependent transporter [Bacteroidales bacterium]|nr:sodium-dependent transporter [Bacteroidales bacterium]HOO66542.1 sodium-dependent transporter [Bacteroidales bacterium]HPE22577.1 sodium-dependent transporter [Bacteroidales bacterium]HPJ04085.1 sodium-dependent transporter [Bacteroidales bacterium]HPQ62746.1 sodium-dependent transporter [Bacteroidales bacterium]
MSGFDFSTRGSFGSRMGVIMAAAGSAVGLGNIWRFPYVLGENGGGAFLIIYLVIIFAIGIPVMMSELVIGRRTQRNPVGAFRMLSSRRPWYLVGMMGIVSAFMILAFYTAVAGWTLEYIYQILIGGIKGKSSAELTVMFDAFRSESLRPALWFSIFLLATAGIVLGGVRKGIEKSTKVLMPLLFILLLLMCVKSLTLPGAGKGIEFLFRPDFSKITGTTVLMALGQAFFSLSIGMGTLITYGSYIPADNKLASTAVQVSMVDLLIAILAGLAIFPAVFAFGISPASGEALTFIVLPGIFQQITGGMIFAFAFFFLLAIAALTSTISVLEVIVAYFSEQLNLNRRTAVIIATASMFMLGIAASLSWGVMKDVKLFRLNIFDLFNFTTANILLPLGGLLIVAFLGWFFPGRSVRDELSNEGVLPVRYFPLYRFIIRFIAPVAIALVFLNGLGLLKF